MHTANSTVWAAFCLYLAITFALAHLAHRRAGSGNFLEEFFVGGRTLGSWVLGLTWVATSASGGTFIGAPSLGHANGWSVMLWISGYIVVATVGFGLLGRRIAEIGQTSSALTFSDLLRDRFDSRAIGVISGIALIVLHTSFIVAQYIAGARVLEVVLGVPYVWGATGLALTVCLYTAYGGFRAVAWTDSFQAIVMLVGVLLTAGFALRKAGGFAGVFDGLAAQSPELLSGPGPDNFLPLPAAISFFFIWPLAVAGQPALITRFLACRDTAALKRASFLIGCYILLLYPAVIFVGIAGRVLVPNLAAPDHALPATILAAVPPLLAGFVLAAPLAAIMSTVSSFLLVSSSALVRDLYQRNINRKLQESATRRLTHLATFAVAAVAVIFALRPPDYLQYIVVFSGTGLAATFLMPIVLGVYWPGMNRTGCLAGIAAGFSSFLLQYALFGTRSFYGFDPFVWSLGICALACGLGSRLGSPEPDDLLQRYFGVVRIRRIRGRGARASRQAKRNSVRRKPSG